jgi:rubrerythrin
MSLGKTFYLLKNAELQACELYSLIGLSIAITQPGLSDLFNDLAKEEELHARQIELLRNLFLESEGTFLETPESEKMITEFMENLEMAKNHFNQHQAQMQPRDLINLALNLEGSLVEKHRTFFLKVTDPQIKQLFESLNFADKSHIRKLETFAIDQKSIPRA